MRTGASSRRWSALTDRSEPVDLVTLKDELTRVGRARRRRRPGLHQRAHRRRAALGQRRALREDRQGKVHAAPADPVGQRRARRAPTTPRRTPTTCSTRPSGRSSRSPSTGCGPGFVPRQRAGRLRLSAHRAAAAAARARHRRAERLRRSRRDDVRLPEVGPRHRRGPAVDGQDELRAEHGAATAASRPGKTVGIFSLEMSKEQLFMRMLTSEARVDAHRFRGGFLGEQDYARLVEAFARLHDAKVFIDDTPSVGILEMRAKARRLKLEHGLDMLVIDYLQLMQGRGRFENRQQELASISRSLKILAKELERARSSRSASSAARRRPAATTGRSCRTCASRAPSSRTPTSCCSSSARTCTRSKASAIPKPKGMAEIIIGKQRNGPTGHGAARVPQAVHAVREPRAGRRVRGRRDGDVIRPTVATVDLDADPGTTSRAIRALLDAGRADGAAADAGRARASSPSSRRTPTVTARPTSGRALEAAGASMLACADIEEGVALREAGVTRSDSRVRRAQRQRSRRRVRARAHADGLDARRPRARSRRPPRARRRARAVTSRSTPA